jgi:hypothetical protein
MLILKIGAILGMVPKGICTHPHHLLEGGGSSPFVPAYALRSATLARDALMPLGWCRGHRLRLTPVYGPPKGLQMHSDRQSQGNGGILPFLAYRVTPWVTDASASPCCRLASCSQAPRQ